MKKLLTILFCATALTTFAQSSTGSSLDEMNTSANILANKGSDDNTQSYPGGVEAFNKFVSKNLQLPDGLEPGQKETIQYLFVVESDGYISNFVELLEDDGEYTTKASSIMNELPYWDLRGNIPSEQVYFTSPVTFIAK